MTTPSLGAGSAGDVEGRIRSWPYFTDPYGTRMVDMTVDDAVADLADILASSSPHVEPEEAGRG